jgi:transposase InsO family protein
MRITGEYLSTLKRQRGATPRAQRSRSLRKTSGIEHFPAIRPGQVVAIDATRADNLVYSPLTGKPYSVEILTAVDVSTRVVLALRVTPRSADGLDAGLMVYDICRPFSAIVQGTTMTDWRWVGLPEQLDLSQTRVRVGRQVLAPDFTTLQGQRHIPSVRPDAIHADQGAIFVSRVVRATLRDFGIDLLLSRGGHPTDNPHVERWHETFQRALQQFPGYKGRNTSERGRVSAEPLMTAHELQDLLRRFVALDYHRSWHTGLILPGEPAARLCPLEMWDAMVEVTGRIDVPQTPDLIYQFLPIRWLTISHQGVEWANLVYDSTVLDDYRIVPMGYFRAGDCAAPFYVDPHDMSRIWFRDPKTGRVQPIVWRGAARTDAPMTARIVGTACRRIRDRGGNTALKRDSATRQILDELTELARVDKPDADWSQLAAATLRVEQARWEPSGKSRFIMDWARQRYHPKPKCQTSAEVIHPLTWGGRGSNPRPTDSRTVDPDDSGYTRLCTARQYHPSDPQDPNNFHLGRDHYNQLHLPELQANAQADVDRLQAQFDALAKQAYMGDHDAAAQTSALAPQLAGAKHSLGGFKAVQADLGRKDGLKRYLGTIDDQGHAAVAIGNPDYATRNATFVPGTGQDLTRFDGSDAKSVAMYNAAHNADPHQTVAVTWPDSVSADALHLLRLILDTP